MLAKPYRVESRVFSSISRQTARTRTVGISRDIVRLAAFLREDTRSRGFTRDSCSRILSRANAINNFSRAPIGDSALNEFYTDGLVFPTLFPYGHGDPTSKHHHHTVTLTNAFKHLIKYCDIAPDGHCPWYFASHPRFPYWALDIKHRHQLSS